MTLVAENDEAHAAATATTWIACVGLMGGRGGVILNIVPRFSDSQYPAVNVFVLASSQGL